MTGLIIRNVLLSGSRQGELSDIYIDEGIISRISPAGIYSQSAGNTLEADIFDAGGRVAIPGMIDPHVHLRSPGMEEKEDWVSGSLAAIAGGVTTLIDMPNTKPATETPEALELKRSAAAKADRLAAEDGWAAPRRLFWAGCSPDSLRLLPQLLAEPDVAGVKLFFSESSANKSSSDIGFITKVFTIAAEAGKPVAVHSELAALLNPEAADSSLPVLTQHNRRRPAAAAVAGTALALEIASITGCRLYLCHLSTMAEFAMVKKQKEAYGRNSVIAELTPHHLLLDEDHIVEGGEQSWAKVNPPLRTKPDRTAAEEALLDGTIDCIGSDHAPHQLDEKGLSGRDFHDCPSGFPGLETELPLVAGFLRRHETDGAEWLDAVSMLTNNRAAEVFGLNDRLGISAGKLADIVIIGGPGAVVPASFKTKAKYSPFNGMKTEITVYKTIIGGKIIEQ